MHADDSYMVLVSLSSSDALTPVFTQAQISIEYSLHFQNTQSYLNHCNVKKKKKKEGEEWSYLHFPVVSVAACKLESLTPHVDCSPGPCSPYYP